MTLQAPEAFALLLAALADATHDICLQAAGSERREFLVLAHRPRDRRVGQTLRTRFHGHPVAVCLELNKGPSCGHCAKMISSCFFLSLRSPWPRTAQRLPPAEPQTTPPTRNSRSHSSSHTVTSSSPCDPTAPPGVPSPNSSNTASASSVTQSVAQTA